MIKLPPPLWVLPRVRLRSNAHYTAGSTDTVPTTLAACFCSLDRGPVARRVGCIWLVGIVQNLKFLLVVLSWPVLNIIPPRRFASDKWNV